MRKSQLHTEVRNYSRYSIDLVWDNAKDLEHVAYLHSNTNKEFKLLYVGQDPTGKHEYDVMIYRTKRRFYFLNFETFGFRRIMSKYQIHQLEYIPLLGITTALNSLLYRTNESEHPTLMLDEVIMEMPMFLAPLKGYFAHALKRHTTIQCSEDEPFRARRLQLKEKNIFFPFSIFNKSQWSELTSQFSASLPIAEGQDHHVPAEKILVSSTY